VLVTSTADKDARALVRDAFGDVAPVMFVDDLVDDRLRVGYPLLELPDVLGSPHDSGLVDGWFELGLGCAAKNVRRHLLGAPFVGLGRREDHAG
jgi:hypothetical protein